MARPYLGNPKYTIEVLQKYHFVFQKRFGQNFLIDEHVLEKIIDSSGITKDDFILEIGPGIGTMTQYLAEAAREVAAVEIDSSLIPILKDTLKEWDNVTVINNDILKTDIKKIANEKNGGKPVKVVANLPYYITTPIIMGLFEKNVPVDSITVMVQKEVADRMQVGPGTKDYGALSLAVQYYAKPEIVANVPPNCFMPRPKVGSAVIKLTRYEKPPVEVHDERLMFRLIRASFNQRRKTLVNGIKNSGDFSLGKEEIEKIQTGFKKAVDEEVKSQRMKTELVTNVSHDLKTPLTAIITYVNLLKMEHDPERQKEYIDVLDRKSLRLKALIEDLFEISKASSRSVNLNIIEMDIVNLFKQVKLEMEEKITEANLDFRLDIPEEKVIVALDGQKTYRIFENLIGNAVKYAMPHTRVYVKIAAEEGEAVFRMKNVSATELTFNPEEITERFVRGDSARNTEGSGLGLAIVKSFVEIQKGKFWIETEADLFKAEIRWKLVDKKDDIA